VLFWRLFRNLTDIYTMIIIVQISVISREGIVVLAIVTGTPLTGLYSLSMTVILMHLGLHKQFHHILDR
jgi:hypothetical protein